jgi:hypothetical protein
MDATATDTKVGKFISRSETQDIFESVDTKKKNESNRVFENKEQPKCWILQAGTKFYILLRVRFPRIL